MRDKAQSILTEHLGPFGRISFPYFKMGKVDSLDLFGANELILFAFYWHNRARYRKVADLGANLGLHSILMAKLGWEVRAYEPDPLVFNMLATNLKANKTKVQGTQAAVSDRFGTAKFVRVVNNLTGSHILGSKPAYGPLENIEVPVTDCRPIFDWADLAKLDVEGHELTLLRCVTAEHLQHLDLICELRGKTAPYEVLSHFQRMGANVYSQKIGWEPAQAVTDLPTEHWEGSVFISSRHEPFEITISLDNHERMA